jgi:hypothetical protein
MTVDSTSMNAIRRHAFTWALAAGCIALAACAQPEAPSRAASASTPSSAAAAPSSGASDKGPVAALAWLSGCWQNTVNQREFREQWLPDRGGMLIGAGQQVMNGQVQDYEFMRIEARADGVYFTQFSGERKESSFKLASTTSDHDDTIYTFANTTDAFPARLIYRRGTEGWLYETVEGPLAGSDKRVIYPLRRVDCESGELITK